MDWKLLWNVKRVWLEEENKHYTYYQILISSWILLPATSKKINNSFLFETFCGTIYVDGKGTHEPVRAIVRDIEIIGPNGKLDINTESFLCFDGVNQQLLYMAVGSPDTGSYILNVNINGDIKTRETYYNKIEDIELPKQIFPYDEQILQVGNINFQWSKLSYGYYGLEVQTINNERVINLSFMKNFTSFKYNMEKGEYKWRVLSFDSDDLMETNNCSYGSWKYFIVE